MSSLKLLSLNVKGLRDDQKRSTLFHWFKQKNVDLILLQETHCENSSDKYIWGHEWEGDTFWSYGTKLSRGVAILVKPNLDIKVSELERDKQGRCVSINIEIDDILAKIVNVYAPNIPSERIEFFNKLKGKLQSWAQDKNNRFKEIILGGDFNCTMMPKLDRRSSHTRREQYDQGSKQLREIMIQNDMEDIWRRRYPSQKRYTYFKPNSKTASRIDYWLISQALSGSATQISISQAIRTDHAAISLTLRTSDCERGPGFWKLNNSVLESDIFDDTFKTFWASWKTSSDLFDSKKRWWELTKVKIKELSIEISKSLAKSEKIKISKTEKLLDEEKNKSNPDILVIAHLENILKEFWSTKSKGARTRSRTLWYEKGENSTKYFFSLEKIKARNKLWSQIKDKTGKIKYGLENILKEQVDFYSELLKSEGWDKESANSLLQNIDKFISDDDKALCESRSTIEELDKVIKILKKDKSPGYDGLTNEFYIKYWHIIRKEFWQVMKEIEITETLCDSQYRGIISLIYKQGDRDDITNWRPITLLNTDYKIITKLYAERLKQVLPSVIQEDQKAFLQGRQITENIRLTHDIIQNADIEETGGAIIFLDQQKAYDRVEWGYLDQCLGKFGFGTTFRKWMQMLYKKGESCINTNGFLSRFFPISRSMRQGCPIAAYLYILQAEPMAQSIRTCKEIKGIPIQMPNSEETQVKIAMFADDTQLFHATIKSVKKGFDILDTYCKASGAVLNLKKTKGLAFGTWKNKKIKFDKIKWASNVKGLGVEFGYNINYEEIWMRKFCKFKTTIERWKHRDLSLQGKKLLINSYIMSSLSYLAEVYTENVPVNLLKETKDLMRDFLWGKTWRIAQATMSLYKEHGGIELPDLDAFIKSRKIMWILKIQHSKIENWNCLGKKYFQSLDREFNTEHFLLQCSSLSGMTFKDIPPFYQSCLLAWAENISKNEITNRETILQQNIFGNCNLLHQGKPLFFFKWAKSNFVTIRDIWNEEDNTFLKGVQIYEQLSTKSNWISEYAIIKQSIPSKWKGVLKSTDEIRIPNEKILQNTKRVILSKDNIIINGQNIPHNKLKKKEVYFHCLYPMKPPTCENKWETLLNETFNWKIIHKSIVNSLLKRKEIDFHRKTIHRAVFTENRLKMMSKSDGLCKLCNREEETTLHLLFSCTKVNDIWHMLEQKIVNVTGVNIKLSNKNALFGLYNHEIPTRKKQVIEFLILETKWHIWKHRNDVKYGKKVIVPNNLLFSKIIKECQFQVNLLLNTSKMLHPNLTEMLQLV